MITRHLPILFALAALVMSIAYTSNLGWRHTAELQGDQYMGYAVSLVRGEGYRGCPAGGWLMCESSAFSTARLPVYPLALAAGMTLTGTTDPLPGLRILQSLWLVALVWLALQTAQHLGGALAAAIAGLLILLNPDNTFYSAYLLTDLLYALLLMLLVWGLLRCPHRVYWLGVLMGLLLLTRGTFLLTLPLIALFVPARRWGVLALGIGTILAPWIIRNLLVFGLFIPFSTGSGDVLYGANSAYAIDQQTGQWYFALRQPGFEAPKLSEYAYDQYLRQQMLEELRTIPAGQLVRHVGLKIARQGMSVNIPTLVSLLIVIGAWAWQPRRMSRLLRLVGALWLGLMLNAAVFYGIARFRYPLDAPTAIAAGVAVAGLVRRLRAHRNAPSNNHYRAKGSP